MKPITRFSGHYSFLSNFYASVIKANNKVWPTAEHIYQALKTLDVNQQEKIRLVSSPGKAKRLSRKLTLRSDWDLIKKDIMLMVVTEKFKQNNDLAKLLLQTGDTQIIEGNTWHDNFWGDCSCLNCENIPGANTLGKILMQVREEMQNNG